MKELTIKDIIGNKEGMIKIDFSKIKERIQKCNLEKEQQQCKKELKEMGVEWFD